jgi:acetyltransferase-like isoleucine patch superfamily enzyme
MMRVLVIAEKFAGRALGAAQRRATRFIQRSELLAQLEAVAHLGAAVSMRGPMRIGNPANTFIGDGVSVNPGLTTFGEGALCIGSHVHMGENVRILTANHNYEMPAFLPYDKVRVAEDVYIGDFVWLCDGVTIVPGVSIGEGAIVAAGSVVVKDVPPLAIAGGAPARVIKYRNEDAYRQLKADNKILSWPSTEHSINGRAAQLDGKATTWPLGFERTRLRAR